MADEFDYETAMNNILRGKEWILELENQFKAAGASPQEAATAAVETVAQAQPKPRTVSAPVYTMGGKRMEGARRMTPQEIRMEDNPAAQMGIDAGAALSRGINSAGLGLPGVALEYFAPNALAGIRENEANANMVARGVGDLAGGLSAPVGTIGRGITGGAKTAFEAFNALPMAGKAGLAFGTASALPTEAATPENTKPNDFTPPSLWEEAVATVKNKLMGQEPGTDQPMTMDEFKQSRRTIQPKTFEAILAEEKAAVSKDPTYTYSPRHRAALEQKAEKNAALRFDASQKDLAGQEDRLGKEYDSYTKGWQEQRDKYYDRQFTERHPKTAMAMTIGGPILSAAATKGIFGKIDAAGSKIAADAATARAGGDMTGLAENLIRADNYAFKAPIGKGLTVAEATLLPAEMRMMQDVIDKKGLPPNAGARIAAEKRMADIPSYAAGMGWDLVSGLTGTAAGGLLNKRFGESPASDMAVARAYGRGIDTKGLAPDEIANVLTARMQPNKLAGPGPSATPPGSGGGPSPTPGPLPQVQGVVVEPNALAGQPTSARGSLAERVQIQRQMPMPEAAPSPAPAAEKTASAAKSGASEDLPAGMWRRPSDGVLYWKEGTGKGGHPVEKSILKAMGLENKKPATAATPRQGKTEKMDESIPDKPSVQIDDSKPYGR